MNKDIKKILLVLALFSLSGGFFYNFWELWLADNNMSLSTISTILSLCSLMSVSVIFLSSNIISPKRIKSFLLILIIIKSIAILALFFLYKSNLNVLIKFLILLDYAIDTEIFACFYPLIAIINKDDKLYAVRGLIYDICYCLGVLIVSILLGVTINNIVFDYNTNVLIASLLLFISIIILKKIRIDEYCKNASKKDSTGLLLKLLKEIKNDKISKSYLTFVFCTNIGFYSVMGLVLTIMVNQLSLAPQAASNLKLSVSICSVGIAALIIAKFTFKNNYANISMKFLTRSFFYLVAFFFPNKWTLGFALLFTIISSSSYTHVTDAPYINRFSSDKQLAFANLKEIVGYLSRSIGTLLCGIFLTFGLRYNYLIAAIMTLISVLFAYQARFYYDTETKRGKNGRKRLG